LAVGIQNFTQLGGHADFYVLLFGAIYLAISQWIRQKKSTKFCANLGKSATETLALNRQAIGRLNGMLCSGQTEKGEAGKEQSQKHAHHFL
jgi:hypothetical protein